MSKLKCFVLVLLVTLCLALGILGLINSNRKGDTSNVKIVIDSESIYSKEDIDKAILVIFDEFKKYPARMETLIYDERIDEYLTQEYIEKYNASEVIVFYSDFVTYSTKNVSKFSNFSQNQRYSDWIWILTRNDGEDWILREWGY